MEKFGNVTASKALFGASVVCALGAASFKLNTSNGMAKNACDEVDFNQWTETVMAKAKAAGDAAAQTAAVSAATAGEDPVKAGEEALVKEINAGAQIIKDELNKPETDAMKAISWFVTKENIEKILCYTSISFLGAGIALN